MFLAGDFATSPSGYFISGMSVVIVTLICWVARTLVKQNLLLDRLTNAVFPERKESLPDQVEAVRDDVRAIRIGGSDKVAEVLEETRRIREQLRGRDDREYPDNPP